MRVLVKRNHTFWRLSVLFCTMALLWTCAPNEWILHWIEGLFKRHASEAWLLEQPYQEGQLVAFHGIMVIILHRIAYIRLLQIILQPGGNVKLYEEKLLSHTVHNLGQNFEWQKIFLYLIKMSESYPTWTSLYTEEQLIFADNVSKNVWFFSMKTGSS